MATLTRIAVRPEATGKTVATSLEVGRTFSLLLLAVVFGVAALVLFLDDNPDAASVFTGFVGLILGAGFGLSQGEKNGAQETAKKLRDGGA